jgi:hypothetical protein
VKTLEAYLVRCIFSLVGSISYDFVCSSCILSNLRGVHFGFSHSLDPMRPSVISTTMVQHHVKKPIGEFSLTLASMSAIFYLSVN